MTGGFGAELAREVQRTPGLGLGDGFLFRSPCGCLPGTVGPEIAVA